jgi:hypothetical protein
MIKIQDDVWRANQIAAFGWDGECELQVYPLHCTEHVSYDYDTTAECMTAYRTTCARWIQEIEAKGGGAT